MKVRLCYVAHVLSHMFDFFGYWHYPSISLRAMEGSLINRWITRSVRSVLLAICFAALGHPSVADPLPKNAVPLSSAEVRKIYSGNSVIWGYRHGAYFSSNGKVISVYTNWHNDIDPRLKWTGYTTGTWSTSGNQMCWRYSGYDLTDKKAWDGGYECFKWYRSGSKFYAFHSKKPRGKRPSGADDYYANERSKIRNGDRISIWFNEYKIKAKAQ